jgi:hypothetical protein
MDESNTYISPKTNTTTDADRSPSPAGDSNLRSLSSPRILLSFLFAVILFLSVTWAYVERPRLDVGFGGISDTISIPQSDFNNITVRSGQFRDELENRLTSAEFMTALRAKDILQPPLFREGPPVLVHRITTPPGLDANPLVGELTRTVLDAYQGRALVFIVGESERADIYVMFLFPRSYRVYRPANSWIRWLQEKLPGMPDTMRLEEEAEAANKAAKVEPAVFEGVGHACSTAEERGRLECGPCQPGTRSVEPRAGLSGR